MLKKTLALVLTLSLVISCSQKPSVDATYKNVGTFNKVSGILINNNELIVSGDDLSKTEFAKIRYNGFEYPLEIKSKTNTKVAFSIGEKIKIIAGSAFSLIIGNAYGQNEFQAFFEIEDGSLHVSKLAPSGAVDGQILKFQNDKWMPADMSGLFYAGTWNPSTNTPDISQITPNAGTFYITSEKGKTTNFPVDGTETEWQSGQWVMFNGTSWDKIEIGSSVVSVFGRTGNVVAQKNDYSWEMINKNLSKLEDISDAAPLSDASDGQFIVRSNGKWIPKTLSLLINNDNIADESINKSKINGLTSSLESLSGKISAVETNLGNYLLSSDFIQEKTRVNSEIQLLKQSDVSAKEYVDTKFSEADNSINNLKTNTYNKQEINATVDSLNSEIALKMNKNEAQSEISSITSEISSLNTNKANLSGDTFTGDVSFNKKIKIKSDGTSFVYSLSSPSSIVENINWIFPSEKAQNGQFLSSDSNGQLSWKTVDFTPVNLELAKKADKTYVDSEIASLNSSINTNTSSLTKSVSDLDIKKADLSYVNIQLELKENSTDVNNKLSTKADISYVNNELDKKAVLTDVNEKLLLKANVSDVTSMESLINSKIALKADTLYVNDEIQKIKTDIGSNTSSITVELSDLKTNKSDLTYVNSELLKINNTITSNKNEALSSIALKADLNNDQQEIVAKSIILVTPSTTASSATTKGYVDSQIATANSNTMFLLQQVQNLKDIDLPDIRNSTAVALSKKADITYVDDQLSLKANLSTMTSSLAEKADKNTVNSSLGSKADLNNDQQEIVAKKITVSQSPSVNYDVTNKEYVDSSLLLKANVSEMNEKADKTNMTQIITALNITGLQTPVSQFDAANKGYVDGKMDLLTASVSEKESAISQGTISQFFRGDKTWQTIDTSMVSENALNKYFTEDRARSAVVLNSVDGSDSTKAPSQNSVKTALDLKLNISNLSSSVLNVLLTGFSSVTASVISATDSILTALQKLQAQIINIKNGTDPLAVDADKTIVVGSSSISPTATTPKMVVNGSVATPSFLASGTVDFKKSNSAYCTSCVATNSITNLAEGAAYTYAMQDTDKTWTPSFFTFTGIDGATLTAKYNPQLAARSSGSQMIFTFMRVGNFVYVTWMEF